MPHINATINPSCRRKRLQARIGKISVSRLQSCSKTLRNPYLSDRSSCDSPQTGRPCSTAGYLEEVCLLHDAQELLLRVTIQDLVRHHLQELLITDRPRAVIIYVRNHLLDLLFLRLESQGTHGYFELFRVNLATSVCIEEIESFLDLLLLLLSQLLLLLTSCIESPQCHLEEATRSNRRRETEL